jgi:hypothetical protein
VLSAIAIVPSAPVLVPELAGAAAAEIADLRAAVVAAAAALPARWSVVGTGPVDAVVSSETSGTFAGFGVDVRVRLRGGSHLPATPADSPDELPGELQLCALMAAWVRGRARPDASVQVHVYADDHDPATAVARGRRLRAEIDLEPDPIGVLVVADGVSALTPSSPGGYDPAGAGSQLALDDALATGDTGALTRLPVQVRGRVAFAVLAGLAEPGVRSATELYRGAPHGVGYFTGVWLP